MSKRTVDSLNSSVSQYLQSARELLLAGKYDTALETVSVAKEIDPNNLALSELADRLLTIQAGVAAGDEQKGTLKESGDLTALTPREIQERVKYLVKAADSFMMRGMNESAFGSLMRAYLLDPVAPEVISCEQTLIPILEAMDGKSMRMWDGSEAETGSEPGFKPPSATNMGGRGVSILRRWGLR